MELLLGGMGLMLVFAIVSTITSFARLPGHSGTRRVTLAGAVASLIGISLLIGAGVTRQERLTIEIIGVATLSALCLLLIGACAAFHQEAPET